MIRRDFTLLWSASAASQLGYMCAATANPLLALVVVHSPVFAGWVTAVGSVPALLMYLPAGWLVDRYDRRRLMFVSQVARLAVFVLLICALGLQFQAAPMLVVAALCEGAFQVLYSTAEVTMVQRVVRSADLPAALAMNEARAHLAQMAGKPLGGFLLGCGKVLPYCVNILAAVWSLIALRMMGGKGFRSRREAGEAAAQGVGSPHRITTVDVLRAILADAFLRTVIVVCAVGNFLFQTVVLALIVLAERQHMSGARIGLLLATSGVGGLIGSVIAPKVRKRISNEWNIIRFCVLAWLALTCVVAVSADPVAGLIAWGGLSVTGGFLNVAIFTHQARRVPDQLLGRVMGINRLLTSGAVPLGAVSAGYFVARLGPAEAARHVFFVITAMAVMAEILLRPRMLLRDSLINWLKARLLPSVPAAEQCAGPEWHADSAAPNGGSASSDVDGFTAVCVDLNERAERVADRK